MQATIVEDRVLARIAYEAAGHGAPGDIAEAADIAYGQAVIALRIHGIAAGPQALRAMREDIDCIFADPDLLARARSLSPRPVKAARPALRRVAVG